MPILGPWFKINNCFNEKNKIRAFHQPYNYHITSSTTFSHNVLVWIKLVHSCMHTCLCLNHIEWYVYVWMLVPCLDGGEDLNNFYDCCACAGCFDQGKWHSCPIFIFTICISAFQIVSMIGILFFFQIYAMLRTPSSV